MSRIYAIGDLHLPGGSEKPMGIFGQQWVSHFDKISADWHARVQPEDVVLIPGDISWAMQLADAIDDLNLISRHPGRKILIKGNHDYWWGAISRIRDSLPAGMYALQNDAVMLDGILFCGTRGWMQPVQDDPENQRIYSRELARMELSLVSARRADANAPLVVLTHFPPMGEGAAETPMTRLLSRYGVRDVFYGHLHGISARGAWSGPMDHVNYHFVSCDGLDFKLFLLPDPQVEV
jgi:uncharacterized protein